MKGVTYPKFSVFLWAVLAAGVVVELVLSAWHGTWELQPLLPAVLSGGIYQIVTSSTNPGERLRVPGSALVLMTITCVLTVFSSVVAWLGGDTSKRTGAVIAVSCAVFFLGALTHLKVRAGGTTKAQRSP